MNLRNVLIIILILVVLAHFGGLVPFMYGGPIGLLIIVALVLVLAGVL